MSDKKEAMPDKIYYRFGELDKHPFVVAFGLLFFSQIAIGLKIGADYQVVANVVYASIFWLAMVFIIRGIYFAIKKRARK